MKKQFSISALATLAAFAGPNAFAGHHAVDANQLRTSSKHPQIIADRDVVSVRRQGTFELDMAPAQALPLFTGPGEELWVPGWQPQVLRGNGFETGTVFVTRHSGHTTYWQVLDYDTRARRARYSRVTPGLDIGTVEVALAANGKGGSVVTVAYQLTSLGQAGKKRLQDNFSEPGYLQMMQEWRKMIVDRRQVIDAHFTGRQAK